MWIVTDGRNLTRSLNSWTGSSSSRSVPIAVIASGTSCKFCSRFDAVTTMSRSSLVLACCASAVPDEHRIVLPSRKAPLVVNTVESFRMRSPSNDSHVTENAPARSEEHTSELQSLMRISYAVFCLQKTKTNKQTQ